MREQTDSHSHHDQAHLRPHIISAIHQPHLESSPASLPRDTNTPPACHISDANGNGNANANGGSGTTGESINLPSQEVGYGEKQLSGASSPLCVNHVQVPIQRQPTPKSHLHLSSPSSCLSRHCIAPSTRVPTSPRPRTHLPTPSDSAATAASLFHVPTEPHPDEDFDAYSDFDPDAGEDVPTDVDTDIDTDPEPEPEIVVPEPVRELTSAEREALLVSCGIIVRDYAYAPRPVG